MRIFALGVAVVLCLTSSAACGAADTMTDEQKTLYAIGLALSQSLGNFMLTEAELELVKAGLTDGVLKRKTKVELQEFGPKIQELQKACAANPPAWSFMMARTSPPP